MHPDLPLSTASASVDASEHTFLVALRDAVRAGTPKTSALHDAVCRLARTARARQVPSQEVVESIGRRMRAFVTAVPSRVSIEFDRQLAWWVAQEYHRDD